MNIEAYWESYQRTGSVHKTGAEFGVSGDRVHKALKRAGKALNRSFWTDNEVALLRAFYAVPEGVDANVVALALGRTVAAVSCKAEEIGITSTRGKATRTVTHRKNLSRAQKELAQRPGVIERRVAAVKAAFARNGHPRGFAGHKRTPEELEKLSAASKAAWADPAHRFNSPEFRQLRSDQFSKLAATRPPENCYSRTKSGWIEVDGVRLFARSRWEANYARYLAFLRRNGEIQKWEHEPETFWFEKIKRGVRSYLPDFRVTLKTGAIEYHEVKGWMDAKSKTKIKRMAKYYPAVRLVVIDQKRYTALQRQLCKIVPEWTR